MMQCTVCHKPYIGPKNHYVCTYCGASIESPVDLKKDPDHLRDVRARAAKTAFGATAISSPCPKMRSR